MKKKKLDSAPVSVVERELHEIADLCARIEQMICKSTQPLNSMPLLDALIETAEHGAQQRYLHWKQERLTSLGPEATKEQTQRAKIYSVRDAEHADHPAFIFARPIESDGQEVTHAESELEIDFSSDLHLAFLLEKIGVLKTYAEITANNEKSRQSQNIPSHKSDRGRPQKLADPHSLKSPLTSTQSKIFEIDLRHSEINLQDGPWIVFRKPASNVAQMLGITKRTVEKCRAHEQYLMTLKNSLLQSFVAPLTAPSSKRCPLPSDEIDAAVATEMARIQHNPGPYIQKYIYDNWAGPVVSQLDGLTYQSPKEYADHLIARQIMPAGIKTSIRETVESRSVINKNANA